MPTTSRALRHPQPQERRGDGGFRPTGSAGHPAVAVLRAVACTAVSLLAGLWSSAVLAAVPWHPALPVALKASASSHRPVLVVFTASWSSASTAIDRTTLASDEAVALITSCFEPVCVDVDAAADLTGRLGIEKVPTAVILGPDATVLARFEVPETPAEFVASAARGLQEASFSLAHQAASGGASPRATRAFGDTSPDLSGALPAFGGGTTDLTPQREAVGGSVRGTQAVGAVAAKVRRLSSFAAETSMTEPADTAIAASFRESDAPSPAPAQAPLEPPSRDPAVAVAETAPETTAAPGPAVQPPSSRTPGAPSDLATAVGLPASAASGPLPLEPGPASVAPGPSSAAPWLGSVPPRVGGAPPAATDAAAVASTARGPAAAPAATTAQATAGGSTVAHTDGSAGDPARLHPGTSEEKTAPAPKPGSALLAALQKPLSLFAAKPKQSAKDEASATAPAGASTTGAAAASAGGLAAAQSGTVAPASAQEAADAEAADDPYGSMPVGMEGYCPVTLAERGAWVEGRAQWGVRHRGRTYLFAGADQQKAFLADPDRYAPVLSGDDPVLALDGGKSMPGQRRYGVTYQSRTYLFSSTETRDAFAANPQRYTGRAVVAEHAAPESSTVRR